MDFNNHSVACREHRAMTGDFPTCKPTMRFGRGIPRLCALVLLWSSLACGTIDFATPSGFAKYTRDAKDYRAISADGIRIKVRRLKNDPYGDLKMWSDAAGQYLADQGYRRIMDGTLDAPGGFEGRYEEYRAIYNGKTYAYITGYLVGKDDIYIIETTGEESVFGKRRDAIMRSIKGFNPLK